MRRLYQTSKLPVTGPTPTVVVVERSLPFEIIFGDPRIWSDITGPSRLSRSRLSNFLKHLNSYIDWLLDEPARTPQEETALMGLTTVFLNDPHLFTFLRPMIRLFFRGGRMTQGNIFNQSHYSYDTPLGWFLRKLWPIFPVDVNSGARTFESQLAFECAALKSSYYLASDQIAPDLDYLRACENAINIREREYAHLQAWKAGIPCGCAPWSWADF